jgi:hypothetical protein
MDYTQLKNEGDLHFERLEFLDALNYYDQAIALRPQFVAAIYRKGEALFKLERFLESASCFWSAYLFFQFRKEPLLMCARALEAAGFSFEACSTFAMLRQDDIDLQSMIFYISALIQEGRVADAAALLPQLQGDDSFNTNLLRGRVCHEFGLLAEARSFLEKLLPADTDGRVADRLIGIYTGLNEFDALTNLLNQCANSFSGIPKQADYYKAVKIALEIFHGEISTETECHINNLRFSIIDSAAYLYAQTQGKIPLSGASQQTFEMIKDKVMNNGAIAEFGVRNGHTINLLATLFPDHDLYGFDSFKGIPETWNDEPAGSYSAGGRLPKVASNVQLIDGWFDKTLPVFTKQNTEILALLNIDCDLYSSTKTIFDCLGDRIVAGSIIIFDEYISNPSWREDEFKAFQEWVENNGVKYEYLVASFYTKQVAVKILSKEI